MRRIQVIAEIANYWHGDEQLLKDSIKAAAACQVNFFKVQLANSERVGNPWQSKKEVIKSCEIKENLLKEIKYECDTYGLNLLATVHHADRIELCEHINVTNIKIASGQIHPLLIKAIAEKQWERVFVSTGMIQDEKTLDYIPDLVDCCNELIVMHCVSLYPTYDCELNLSRIMRLNQSMDSRITVGYSCHHMDDLPAFLAVGLGAEYLEKHFRPEGCFGPTSEVGVDEKDMGNFVGLCKRMSIMWGDGRLTMQDRELYSYNHYKTRYII